MDVCVLGKKGKRKNKTQKIDNFLWKNKVITIHLTNHVFERLRDRMGWTRKYAVETLGKERKIELKLTEGMVYPRKDSWMILVQGLGVFVIVDDEESPGSWVAVTYYRKFSKSYEIE
ncbi:MAG: hypothetical protein HOE59_02035 [Euryarchaeota archaeon]|nr:hypothetical protein [Euryarchaeota archaeon]